MKIRIFNKKLKNGELEINCDTDLIFGLKKIKTKNSGNNHDKFRLSSIKTYRKYYSFNFFSNMQHPILAYIKVIAIKQ